ncbi:hypothetical protein ACF0H5_018658 [Mactra antiquata]
MVRMELKGESLDKEISKTNFEAKSALEELKLERERFRSDIAVFENQIKAEKERAELDRANIDNKLKEIKQERETFKSDIAVYENQIKAEKERAELDRANIDNKLKELKQEREALKSDIAVYENQIKAEKEQAGLDKTKMESELKELIGERFQNEMNSMRESLLTPNVLFKARYVKDVSPSKGDTIVFTDIMMNNGDGYDSNTGVFTAPVNGTYLFTIHMCLRSGKILYYKIVHDNIVHTSGVFYGDKSQNSCHTADDVMYLSVGQKIWLKCSYSTGSSVYTNVLLDYISSSSDYRNRSPPSYWNAFSGLIIHL